MNTGLPGSAKALTAASSMTVKDQGRPGRSDAFAIAMPIPDTYSCSAVSDRVPSPPAADSAASAPWKFPGVRTRARASPAGDGVRGAAGDREGDRQEDELRRRRMAPGLRAMDRLGPSSSSCSEAGLPCGEMVALEMGELDFVTENSGQWIGFGTARGRTQGRRPPQSTRGEAGLAPAPDYPGESGCDWRHANPQAEHSGDFRRSEDSIPLPMSVSESVDPS